MAEMEEHRGGMAVADERLATPVAGEEASVSSIRLSTIPPILEGGNILSGSSTDVETTEQRNDSIVAEEHSSTSVIAAKTPEVLTRPSTIPPIPEGSNTLSESSVDVEMTEQSDSIA
jgi:hypothetical protein